MIRFRYGKEYDAFYARHDNLGKSIDILCASAKLMLMVHIANMIDIESIYGWYKEAIKTHGKLK